MISRRHLNIWTECPPLKSRNTSVGPRVADNRHRYLQSNMSASTICQVIYSTHLVWVWLRFRSVTSFPSTLPLVSALGSKRSDGKKIKSEQLGPAVEIWKCGSVIWCLQWTTRQQNTMYVSCSAVSAEEVNFARGLYIVKRLPFEQEISIIKCLLYSIS